MTNFLYIFSSVQHFTSLLPIETLIWILMYATPYFDHMVLQEETLILSSKFITVLPVSSFPWNEQILLSEDTLGYL